MNKPPINKLAFRFEISQASENDLAKYSSIDRFNITGQCEDVSTSHRYRDAQENRKLTTTETMLSQTENINVLHFVGASVINRVRSRAFFWWLGRWKSNEKFHITSNLSTIIISIEKIVFPLFKIFDNNLEKTILLMIQVFNPTLNWIHNLITN